MSQIQVFLHFKEQDVEFYNNGDVESDDSMESDDDDDDEENMGLDQPMEEELGNDHDDSEDSDASLWEEDWESDTSDPLEANEGK